MFALMMASMMFIIVPRASVSANRIVEVLSLERVIPEEGKKQANKTHGLLEFNDVTFYYEGADEPALKNISFTATPGQTTAIIGGTGSGKTTLINLIPRFYEIRDGTIKINGVDIKETTIKEIREKIGLVTQHALLFTGTVADNIRFGKKDATDEDVKHAAGIAQAHEFIDKMKDGYNTLIEQ